MNWDAIGAIAETLGAVGVIASLVYLAGQIRHGQEQISQNTRTVRAASASDLLRQNNELGLLLGQNAEAARIYFDGLAGVELNDAERRQFEMLIGAWMNVWMQSLILEEEGLLSAQLRSHFQAVPEWVISQPGFDQYWSTWAHGATPQMTALVDSVKQRQADTAAQPSTSSDSA